VEALVNRGVALAALGRLEEALRVTEEALVHEPNRVRALVNAARYRMALGDVEGALRLAERALDVKPGDRGAEAILRSRSRPAGSSGAGTDR
jgi:tetratricopeptide (TPR) repeat protein